MPRFHPLTVTDVRKTTRDAVIVSLKPDVGSDFSFTQGQYLTFRHEIDGIELRRSYSICSGRDEECLQVGIKRVEGGAFSTWANEHLRVGDTLDAMPPMGSFHTDLAPEKPRHYLGFAGGSGITPVLSILKTVLTAEPQARFTLVYANRGVNSIMFRDEIEDLKNLHMGRLSVIHILEQDAQDIDLFTGRVDAEKCDALFESWIDIESVDFSFICGPEPMMLAIAGALRAHGLSDDQIKFELFASAQPGRLPKVADSHKAHDATANEIDATITLDGAAHRFSMQKGISVLDATIGQQLDAPFACKAGVCSTCKCRVLEGEVEMAANHALEDYEVARGYVLSCQAYPVSDRVVIDYDQ